MEDTDFQQPFQQTAQRLSVTGRILSALFLAQISPELELALADPEFLDAWPLTDSFSVTGVDILRDGAAGDEITWRDDALRLFGALGRPLAEPHESVWLSREHLLFEEQTLQVRACYRRYGLALVREGREPDDHIGFELLFMSRLLELLAAAEDGVAGDDSETRTRGEEPEFPMAPHEDPKGRTDADEQLNPQATASETLRNRRVRLDWVDDPQAVVDCGTVLADLDGFYREHLALFAPQVCERLGKHAQARIFRALPDLTLGFLASLEEFLANTQD